MAGRASGARAWAARIRGSMASRSTQAVARTAKDRTASGARPFWAVKPWTRRPRRGARMPSEAPRAAARSPGAPKAVVQ